MRAEEIFESVEAPVPWSAREALPPSMTIPDMDPYYEYYRFLVTLAGHPSTPSPSRSITRDIPFIVPYTPAEHKWVTSLLKSLGKTPAHLTKKPSIEPETVNIKSPVRPFKDYDK